MREDSPITFTLPPWSRATRPWAVGVGSLWVVHVILYYAAKPALLEQLPTFKWLGLVASKVTPGLQLWRVLTYALLDHPLSLAPLWSILLLWWFGAPVEKRGGTKVLALASLTGALGGAAAVLAMSMVSRDFYEAMAVGMEPVHSGLLVAWGYLYAKDEMNFFGLAKMRGWQMAAIFCAFTAIRGLLSGSPLGVAAVGGLLGAALYMELRKRSAGGGSSGGRKRTGSGAGLRVVRGGKANDDDKPRWVN